MNRNMIIAIAAVAVLVGAGVAVMQVSSPPSNGETYEFTDAKGVSHNVEVPLKNVSVVHKYIPIFMKILGVENEVAGLDQKYGMSFKEYFPNGFPIGTYSAPDGEIMLDHGSKVILTPITMGLSNSDALTQLGIEVIYLDLTDPYAIKDNLLLLAKLMGGTPEIMEKYDKYMEIFDGCFTKARSYDLSVHSNDVFGLFMSSAGFYQTHASSAVKVIESISGKCYTHVTDANVTDTVYFHQDKEVLTDVDHDQTLKYMFVYTYDTPKENFDAFFEYGSTMNYEDLTCVQDGHLFSLNPEVVNGAFSCISSLLYAKAFGADIGNSAVDAINQMNTEFGLHHSTDNLLVAYVPA